MSNYPVLHTKHVNGHFSTHKSLHNFVNHTGIELYHFRIAVMIFIAIAVFLSPPLTLSAIQTLFVLLW